ncbi:MAG: DUF4919 domain-containing protein [Flavipsychrobacter sp.]|nr:DUF4919 domain-containing protein [Flavipsychrobacter sp.]
MYKILLLLSVVLLPAAGKAQEPPTTPIQAATPERYMVPDYASIKQMTEDKNSLFYYPNILAKYKNNDTTLSFREYRMLYYGYVFQNGYSRIPELTAEDDSIAAIFEKGMLSQEDLQNMVRFGKTYLEKYPFDLRRLNLVYVAASECGDEVTANTYLHKVRMLALTILTTGNGLKEDTPFYVISETDENALINILGYKPNGIQALTTTRYLTLEDNSDNVPGLYFDLKNVTAYSNN